jgi:hypothetical protein
MVLSFTAEEQLFMKAQGLTSEDFLDARGLKGTVWKQMAAEQLKDIAVGNLCGNGHRLKTRAGHCI